MKKAACYLIILASLMIQSACASLPANPSPVVVAIIDTGFEKTHPALKARVVDSYDFSKGTRDVSPYILKTSSSSENSERVLALVKLVPPLVRWFPSDRDVAAEFASVAYHGTAVASLALYDLPVASALYKVFPIPATANPDEWMTDAILKAMERAANAKARIVNLSLGFTFALRAADAERYRSLKDRLERFVRDHPEMLFIAAAGNENQVLDDNEYSGYPCGLKLANVICVGAVTHLGGLWKVSDTKGTNLVKIPGTTSVFSYGDRVFSAVPQNMCVTKEAVTAIFSGIPVTKALAEYVLVSCQKNEGYAFGEATSIAAPLVTHRALEILLSQPHLSAEELSKEVLRSSTESTTDPKVKFIVPTKPSWAREW